MKTIEEVWVQAQYIKCDGTVEVFENHEVSNLGRVRRRGDGKKRKEKILKLGNFKCSNGTYHTVGIYKNRKILYNYVHRLVLSSFNPTGYFPKAVVDHINSVPGDDRLENLRWVTQRVNVSTHHRKTRSSKMMTNRKDQSKHVRVTFSDGHTETFPSAREADRSLGLPMHTASLYIFEYKGYYKKKNLFFEYV